MKIDIFIITKIGIFIIFVSLFLFALGFEEESKHTRSEIDMLTFRVKELEKCEPCKEYLRNYECAKDFELP